MILFYILIAVMPLSNHPFWARAGGMTMIKYLGVVCLLYGILHLIVRGKAPNILATWESRLFLLFYGIMTASYLRTSHAVSLDSSILMIFTSLLGLVVITLLVVDSTVRLRRVIMSVIGSVAFASAYVIRDWWLYHNAYSGYRPGGLTGDSNYFAFWALMCLPLVPSLMIGRRLWEQCFAGGCLVIILVAFTLAASRGAFLGLGGSFLILLWRSRHRVRILIVACSLVAPWFVVSPSSPLERFWHPNYGDKLGEINRMTVWKAGLRMVSDHPFAGIGAGNFKGMVGQYQDTSDDLPVITLAHNTYLEIAAEMGIPGLLVFVGILFFSFQTLNRIRRITRDSGPIFVRELATSFQASLAGASIALFFLSAQHQKILWLILALAMCLFPLARKIKIADRARAIKLETYIDEETLQLPPRCDEELVELWRGTPRAPRSTA